MKRRGAWSIAAVVLTAACASTPPATSLVLTQRADHIDVAGREPMLAEDARGTLFVAGYGSPTPTLWKSGDRGATWSRVNVGSEADGAIGNSDVDLAISPDGTLYFASMLFDRTVFEGRQISIGASDDAGASWRWTTISKARFDDRPWIDVAPDGTAHVIWNDGSGVSHVTSRDRGRTWSRSTRIHEKGGSSHLAIGPAGEVAVRITPMSASGHKFDAGVDLIAVSTDGGASWQKHPAPGERDWSPEFMGTATPRWVEPIAWDAAGRLYSLWTHKTGVTLARSADRGATWTTWDLAATAAPAFFPYLTAGPRGQLAATWFTASNNADMHDLQWQLALIEDRPGAANPRTIVTDPRTIESMRPREGQGDKLFNDPGGEYLTAAFLANGSIAVVSPIQNRPANRGGFGWWRFGGR